MTLANMPRQPAVMLPLFSVDEVMDNGTYFLRGLKGPLKRKAHAVNLKLFVSADDNSSLVQDVPSAADGGQPVSVNHSVVFSEL